MQFDEASNQRTNQSTIDEGGREQQNCHNLYNCFKVIIQFESVIKENRTILKLL